MSLPDISQLLESYALCVSPEDAFKRVNEDIERHSSFLLALKRYRNELAPVSRLPPELLRKIFSQLQLDIAEGKPEASKNSVRLELRWISVTHVHSHWRKVALQCPTLWAGPPILPDWNSSWITSVLQRSQVAPLSIRFFSDHLLFSDLRKLLKTLQGASRTIKNLAVYLYTHDISEETNLLQVVIAKQWLALSATPALEALCIKYDSYGRKDFPLHMEVPASIFFAGAADNLRKLEFMRCVIDGPLHLPSTITHLKMHSMKHNLGRSDLIRTLGGLKELKVLDLKDFRFSGQFPTEQDANDWHVIPHTNPSLIASEGGSTHNVSVHLAHLAELRVCSVNTSVEAFFRHVTFPASAEVQIDVFPLQVQTGARQFSEGDSARLFANIAQSYLNIDPSAATTNFQSLIIDSPWHQCGSLKDFSVRFTILRDQIKASDVTLAAPRIAMDKIEGDYPLMISWFGNSPQHGCADTIVSNFFKSRLPMPDASFVHMLSEISCRCRPETVSLVGL